MISVVICFSKHQFNILHNLLQIIPLKQQYNNILCITFSCSPTFQTRKLKYKLGAQHSIFSFEKKEKKKYKKTERKATNNLDMQVCVFTLQCMDNFTFIVTLRTMSITSTPLAFILKFSYFIVLVPMQPLSRILYDSSLLVVTLQLLRDISVHICLQ